MSGHADTIRDYFAHSQPTQRRGGDPRLAPYSSLDALVAQIVEQADRIAWLEGEVAGWRIKLAECEERAVSR